MQTRLQILSILITGGLFALIFELVRQRRLMERYSLLWLFSAFVLFVLAAIKPLLKTISTAVGIFYPPAALFVIAFAFVLVMLLHFSLVISKLSDQNKRLAQRIGLLQEQVERSAAPAEDE
jgi:hypothetical protein